MGDIVTLSTSTINGTTTALIQAVSYATSSAQYQMYHDAAALLWLLFLNAAAADFFAIAWFFNKRFNKS